MKPFFLLCFEMHFLTSSISIYGDSNSTIHIKRKQPQLQLLYAVGMYLLCSHHIEEGSNRKQYCVGRSTESSIYNQSSLLSKNEEYSGSWPKHVIPGFTFPNHLEQCYFYEILEFLQLWKFHLLHSLGLQWKAAFDWLQHSEIQLVRWSYITAIAY